MRFQPILGGVAVVLATLLQGCSTTHVITLNPTTTPETRQFSNVHQISVTTLPYSQTTIGNIKTGIGERADIVLANKANDALRTHIQTKLTNLGFTPAYGTWPATDLMVELTKLSYTTKTISLKTEATLVSEIKVTVSQGSQTYTANFKSEKVDQYGTMPDSEVVEKDINALLGKTIDRAFHNKQILKMLIN